MNGEDIMGLIIYVGSFVAMWNIADKKNLRPQRYILWTILFGPFVVIYLLLKPAKKLKKKDINETPSLLGRR